MAVPVRYSIILLTSLIFAKFPQQNASRIFTVELLEANFTSLDTKFMSSAFIILYDTKVAYLEFTLAQEVNEFIAKINVDILRKNNHRTSVMNQTMSGCKFLQNDQKSNLFKIIYKELFRVANFRKCPFLKDTKYFLKNYTIKDDDFPIITPIVEWRFKIEFFAGNHLFAMLVVDGRVRKL